MKKLQFLGGSALRSGLCLGLLATVAAPGAALAQTADDVTADPDATQVVPDDQIPADDADADSTGQVVVVTGSRIPRNTFSTPAPIDVITRDDTLLTGARNPAEVLQSATVTSGSAQINNTFLGYVSEGGPGANTVGLRGLGSQRTLVLLNGRRLAPAGAGPQLVSADLNVLPSAVVQRYEILREGASSIYGSDAIAGVVNIITDDRINGITVDGYTSQPTNAHGGRSYRASIAAGKTFERGHITASAEFRETTPLRVSGRDRYKCPTDYLYDPQTGDYKGQLEADGSIRCFPFNNGVGTAQNYLLGINYTTGGVNRYAYVNGANTAVNVVNSANSRPPASRRQLEEYIYSPVRTFTGYLNGAYEVADDIEVYAEGLFSRRESHQASLSQISLDPAQLGTEIYGGTYNGIPLSAYGYPTSPFFPNALAARGNNVLRVFIVPPLLNSHQKVDYLRGNGGVRGALGVGDLRFDVNAQYARSKSEYGVQGIRTSRFAQSLDVVSAPAGVPDQFVTVALPNTAGAGGRYTCASNITGGAYNGGNCVAADLFAPATLAGDLPQNLFNWLYSDNVGSTEFEQFTVEANIAGSLIDLPAGPLGFAVGALYRHDKINDVPSEASQTADLYNYSSGGITRGSDSVKEVYGELNVPVFKDKPFFKDLTLNLSGRYTDYKSYGSDFTYHVGGNWAPTDFFRIRGNYGTSYRAPNLYEQYVSDQTGFFGGSVDPCNDFINTTTAGSTTRTNCLTEVGAYLNSDSNGDGVFDNFLATGGPQVTTRGGRGFIKAETATTWGVGGVANVPGQNISFAVDYFNIEVRGEVDTLGTGILDFCYESTEFRSGNQYCALIAPRETAQGNLTSFLNPYINVSRQSVEGIDFSARAGHRVGPGNLLVNARATRILHQKYTRFAGEPADDYAGLLGYQGFSGGPKWTGSLDAQYTIGDFTLFYNLEYIGSMDSNAAFGVDPKTDPYDLRADEYFNHTVSARFKIQDLGQFTIGVSNLFDAEPEKISSVGPNGETFPRIGNYFNYSGYDFIGRSVFVNMTRSF